MIAIPATKMARCLAKWSKDLGDLAFRWPIGLGELPAAACVRFRRQPMLSTGRRECRRLTAAPHSQLRQLPGTERTDDDADDDHQQPEAARAFLRGAGRWAPEGEQ